MSNYERLALALKNYKSRSGLSYRDIAAEFGVSKSNIERIINGKQTTVTDAVFEKFKDVVKEFEKKEGLEPSVSDSINFELENNTGRDPLTSKGEIIVWLPRETSGEVNQHTINVSNFPYLMTENEKKGGIRYPKGYDYFFVTRPDLIDDGERRVILFRTKYTLPLSEKNIEKRLDRLNAALDYFGVGRKQKLTIREEVRAILKPKEKSFYRNERKTEMARARFSNEEQRAHVWDNVLSLSAKRHVTREHFIRTGSLGYYDKSKRGYE